MQRAAGGVDLPPPRRAAGGGARLDDRDAPPAHDDRRPRRHAAVAVDDACVADHEVGLRDVLHHGGDNEREGGKSHEPAGL